ncbi:MAG: insulinase family protein [Myxococcales bacterium]|nr:insulinase family protein [Myxococcales bacterium]
MSRTLDNGLLTLVQQRRDSSFSAVCVIFGVGQSDDPEDYEGLAHITEHLMFAPTAELPQGFGRFVEELGASYVNASTSSDATTYCTEVPNEGLERLLYAESTRMGFLLASLNEDHVARERAAVLHEQRERGREHVGWRMNEALDEALWGPSHPYGRPHESEDSVERLRLANVQWFFQRWYGPRNATLAVVGPEDPARVQGWIDRYFGPLRGEAPPERANPPLPEREPTGITVFAPTRYDQLRLAWTTPRYHEVDDAALDVLGDILEERLGERYEDADDIQSVSVAVFSRSRGSVFQVSVAGEKENDLAPRAREIEGEIARLLEEGPTDEELDKTLRRWDRALGATRRSVLTVAQRLASRRVHDRALEPGDARYGELDRETILAAGRRWLRPERRVVAQRRMHGFASFEGDVRRRSLR